MNADEIFARYGKLNFMAGLALAAYHLGQQETYAAGYNETELSGHADLLYATYDGPLHWLTNSDVGNVLPIASASQVQFTNGLIGGVYTHENAAALVGVVEDAVFLAFRGTNDNGAEFWDPLNPNAPPDVFDWIHKGLHYAQFAPLFSALNDYICAHGIAKIYLTGHSLGAAMAQHLVELSTAPGIQIEAVTFADPGFGVATGANDDRITNVWIDGDTIGLSALVQHNAGDANVIFTDLSGQGWGGGDLHSMNLYASFIDVLRTNRIGLDDLRGVNSGINFDNIVIDALSVDVGTGEAIPGAGGNELMGRRLDTYSAFNDILVGGTGDRSGSTISDGRMSGSAA
jgi:hypothetical protein